MRTRESRTHAVILFVLLMVLIVIPALVELAIYLYHLVF